MLLPSEIKKEMNLLGSEKIPFLFVLDFDLGNSFIIRNPLRETKDVFFHIGDLTNHPGKSSHCFSGIKKIMLPSPDEYRKRFQEVQKEIRYGNTYLLNLCHQTEIEIDGTLEDIFHFSKAPFKLLIKDKLVVFSPERFVQVKDGRISTFPMKGTRLKANEKSIDELLNDPKESAEHATITDLLRNDLARVAKEVKVDRYRYIDEIRAADKTILQASSEISGEILPEFTERPGDLLEPLLPAGSVTGAPKGKTLEIIRRVENFKRGFYTGVFGYFDGKNLDSAVMIRYIEKENDRFFYKSGGGITFMSDCDMEYREIIDKIYVPFS